MVEIDCWRNIIDRNYAALSEFPEIVLHNSVHLDNVFKIMMQLLYYNNFSFKGYNNNKNLIKILTTSIYFHDVGLLKPARRYTHGISQPLNFLIERQMHGYFSAELLIEKEFKDCLKEFNDIQNKQIAYICKYHQFEAPINDKVVEYVKKDCINKEKPLIYLNLKKLYDALDEEKNPVIKDQNKREIILAVSLLRFLDCCDVQYNRSHKMILNTNFIGSICKFYDNGNEIEGIVSNEELWKKIQKQKWAKKKNLQ